MRCDQLSQRQLRCATSGRALTLPAAAPTSQLGIKHASWGHSQRKQGRHGAPRRRHRAREVVACEIPAVFKRAHQVCVPSLPLTPAVWQFVDARQCTARGGAQRSPVGAHVWGCWRWQQRPLQSPGLRSLQSAQAGAHSMVSPHSPDSCVPVLQRFSSWRCASGACPC
jgi:hypothetical protein